MNKISKQNNQLSEKEGKLDFSELRKRKTSIDSSLAKFKNDSGSLQIVIMFDITGSMFKYFKEVRDRILEIVTVVKNYESNSEFAIFAYRNYGDEDNYNEIFYKNPFSSDQNEISNSIKKISRGGGGNDGLTCMEECLRAANTSLNWKSYSPKAIVVIGDMPPHGVIDRKSPNNIDYSYEISRIKGKGIKVYSVFCGNYEKVRDFYKKIAIETKGRFLELSEIGLLSELLIGICLKETGKLKEYKKLTGNKWNNQIQINKVLRMLGE